MIAAYNLLFVGVVILLVFFLYIFIMVYITQVPFMRTPVRRFDPLFKYIFAYFKKPPAELAMIDFGSGIGSVLFEAEQRGWRQLIGYEMSPFHVLFAKLHARWRHSAVRVYWQNAMKADISKADIIYMFLTKPALQKLVPKVRREAKAGALMIILGDRLDDAVADHVIALESPQGPKFYCYFL